MVYCFKMNFVLRKLVLIITVLFVNVAICENKYSREINLKKTSEKNDSVDFRTLVKPFRMNKLNMFWAKAKQRLTEPKLKSLYSDLMIQDKEEITLKRVKSEGGDKDGMKEADLRRKLTQIINNYALTDHFSDGKPKKHKEDKTFNSASDDHINKSLFKDKKLNQLWEKAERSGFSSEELATLKEEFYHHDDKIEQYYQLLANVEQGVSGHEAFKNALDDEEQDIFNDIAAMEETNEIEINKDFLSAANAIRDKHRHLRDGYDRLQRKTAKGPNNKEFIEPKVQGLWRMAVDGNFTTEELASLKVELMHYENRLLKLRHLQADHVSNSDKHRNKIAATGDKMDHFADQQQQIKKHARKVEKMHADLEGKILSRHNEL